MPKPVNRRLIVYYATNCGAIRPRNEDSLRIGKLVLSGQNHEKVASSEVVVEPGTWLAVADGLGGHGNGDVASSEVVRALGIPSNRLFDEAGIRSIPGFLMNHLRSRASRGDVSRDMGTTLSGMCFTETEIFILHIGDCRIYSLPSFERLTRDDSHVQSLIERGQLLEEMRNFHPLKNQLTRALIASMNTPAALVRKLPYLPGPGNRFLLCSDGLWENFRDDEMKEEYAMRQESENPVQAFSHWLLEASLDRQPADNVSFIVSDSIV